MKHPTRPYHMGLHLGKNLSKKIETLSKKEMCSKGYIIRALLTEALNARKEKKNA
jgi:hypothetical protein